MLTWPREVVSARDERGDGSARHSTDAAATEETASAATNLAEMAKTMAVTTGCFRTDAPAQTARERFLKAA